MPLASMLPTAFDALISKIKTLLSVPTLIAKEPSVAILIELMSPLWPLRDAIYWPVSEFHTLRSRSTCPPLSKIISFVGLKHTVLTMAWWPNKVISRISFWPCCKFGTTKSFMCLSFEPEAIKRSVRDQSTQYIEPMWWFSCSRTTRIG